MKTRHLGNSGLRVSQIGLGCNVFGQMEQDRAKAVVHKAIDSGITLFDTADVYGGRGGSEEQIGSILGDRRKDIILATKFAAPMDNEGVKRGGSRHYIMQAVEDSLRRLKTDWIDLYQMHQYDPRTPIEETLRALDDLVRAGKVRYIGCSNHPAWRVVESDWMAKTNSLNRFISTQNGYSLINRQIEADILPAAETYGLGVIPYSPLAGGLLSGKYKRGEDAPEGTRLSRPGYGARVLNAARTLFFDVDIPENETGGGLIGKLFGAKPKDPAAPYLERIEQWARRNPFLGVRVYRTAAGLRGLIANELFDPTRADTVELLQAVGSDPLYVRLCRAQGCFRARLTPKPWRCDMDNPPGVFPWEDAGAEARFRRWEALYEQTSTAYAVCRPVAAYGPRDVHPEVADVLAYHDRLAVPSFERPLA
mgnify:CR=1 FL=1